MAKTIEEAESIFSALPAPTETVRRARRGSSARTPPGAGSASGRQAAADAQDERACPEVEEESSEEEDSWAEMQGMSPDATNNLWREHPEHGLQRVRLSSKFVAKHLQHLQNVSDTPPALEEDPEYPGVELSTGKVTDKGVFESVKAR